MRVILLDGILVVNTGQQTLVGDMQQCHPRGFVDATALRFNDTVFNLIAHTQTVTAADTVGFQHHLNVVAEGFTVQSNRMTLFKTHGHFFCRDLHALIPELHAHNRVDDFDAGIQEFQIFCFVSRTEHIGVC